MMTTTEKSRLENLVLLLAMYGIGLTKFVKENKTEYKLQPYLMTKTRALHHLVDQPPFSTGRRILTDNPVPCLKLIHSHISQALAAKHQAAQTLKPKITTKAKQVSTSSKTKTRPMMQYMKKNVKRTKKEVGILYVYHDGVTSGVRKPVTMKELKFSI